MATSSILENINISRKKEAMSFAYAIDKAANKKQKEVVPSRSFYVVEGNAVDEFLSKVKR